MVAIRGATRRPRLIRPFCSGEGKEEGRSGNGPNGQSRDGDKRIVFLKPGLYILLRKHA